MSTSKKYHYSAADILGFHMIISQREPKEASLVGDTAVQSKSLQKRHIDSKWFLETQGRKDRKKERKGRVKKQPSVEQDVQKGSLLICN